METSVTKAPNRDGNIWGRVLSIFLIIAILGALGMLGYTIATPKVGDPFTEFYILGLSGKAMDYPEEIRVGEVGEVIIGIVNHEQEAVSYRIETRIDGVQYGEIEPIILDNDEQWEDTIGFAADSPGDNKKVEFVLYRDNNATPHLKPLVLWIIVTE